MMVTVAGSELKLDEISSWECLAIFQHYGIPTRLLDWSSSLINAIFFSIIDCVHCSKIKCNRPLKKCNGYPCIWILDPDKMHEKLHPGCENIAFTIGVDHIQQYDECYVVDDNSSKWQYNSGPIFMEIPWTHPRIRRQKGYFTFHPNDTPLEEMVSEDGGLVKIELYKDLRDCVLDEFEVIGISEHDIYTDLASLSTYLKRKYNL